MYVCVCRWYRYFIIYFNKTYEKTEMKRIVGGAVERLQRLCLICQVDDDGCVRIHAGLLFLASIFPIYTCGSKRHEQTEEGIRITRNPRTAHREKERERWLLWIRRWKNIKQKLCICDTPDIVGHSIERQDFSTHPETIQYIYVFIVDWRSICAWYRLVTATKNRTGILFEEKNHRATYPRFRCGKKNLSYCKTHESNTIKPERAVRHFEVSVCIIRPWLRWHPHKAKASEYCVDCSTTREQCH